MYNLFGFTILSKEEKEEQRREYAALIFPYGDEQRKRVEEKLFAKIKKPDRSLVMYFYISVKEMMKKRDKSFDEAVAELGKMSIPPGITPEVMAEIKTVLEEDMKNEHDGYSES